MAPVDCARDEVYEVLDLDVRRGHEVVCAQLEGRGRSRDRGRVQGLSLVSGALPEANDVERECGWLGTHGVQIPQIRHEGLPELLQSRNASHSPVGSMNR